MQTETTSRTDSINHQLAYSMAFVWLQGIILLVGVLVASLTPELLRIEDQKMQQHLERAIGVLEADLKRLETFSRDWSEWDDAYDFMAGRNTQEFIETNLERIKDPKEYLNLSLISFVDAKGHERWGHSTPPDSMKALRPQLAPFLARFEHEQLPHLKPQGIQGFYDTPLGPVLFAIHPITDSHRKQPSNGYLLVGHWIDESVLHDMSDLLNLNATLQKVEPDLDGKQFKMMEHRYLYRTGYGGFKHLRGSC